MNKKNRLLLITMLLLISCLNDNLSTDGLPVIDVTKKHPEKEIILSDIADIKYLHLDTKNKDFLYRGTIQYITENTIVVQDVVSGSILFFSKDGSSKSRFNRFGDRPEEYFGIGKLVYDEMDDDVFICQPFINIIQVYSSKGEYKRKLVLPDGVTLNQMYSFDIQSLIVFDESRRHNKVQPKTTQNIMDYQTHLIDSSFFLVSKADGQVLDYIQMSTSQNDLSFKTSNGNPMLLFFTNIVKHVEGFLLCNPETDTVFLYSKKKELTPIICKIPLVDKSDPKVILNNCIDVDKYQFMEVQTVGYEYYGENNRNKNYVRDKKTGELFLTSL